MTNKGLRKFYFIFTASGFAGLIYESLWSHYLKLFLGHAAYAQALVLVVFMGGMAIGSLICSRYSFRLNRLLLGYAIIEAIIGICAVFFHPVYIRFIDLSYGTFIPSFDSPLAVAIFKWVAATLLILPQSILLGMTFPLMTSGLLRKHPQTPGAIVAMLYFTNSLGAVLGVLSAGFLFIGWVGLPGSLVLAGLINLIVAAVIWIDYKQTPSDQTASPSSERKPLSKPASSFMYPVFLLIALLTGLSSFIYEIGWIRMLSLVLGSSTHAFELMLAAFILGIALGGFWIKRRIDGLHEPRQFLAFIQIAMGILAVATLPIYGSTFNVMSWLMRNLPSTEIGYVLFNIASHGIALIIMMPAAFCAGMTLPLITTALVRNGNGERSIGAVYGLNTIGSILGVLIAVNLGMPFLGLKGTIILGAAIDTALGIGLAWWALPRRRVAVVATLAGIAGLLLPFFLVTLDPIKMSSGVYRHGRLLDKSQYEIPFYQDGKTASVSLLESKKGLTILTNGKPEASIRFPGYVHSPDEYTMVLGGTLGPILHPQSKTAAIIGWGSGLTTHALLTSPNITSVDTIEIEPEMVRAAKHFGPRVRLAYDDPRSHLQIEDAKSYFSFQNKKYDIIISEPSNPWVSGVASLFTQEFYARIRGYLSERGLFIQWFQIYEIDPPLIASIFNALSDSFSDYAIYGANDGDILIVASPTAAIENPDPEFLKMNKLNDELKSLSINGLSDIQVRLIGNKRLFSPYFESYLVTTNSDYAPIVDLYAVRSRFLRKKSKDLFHNGEPLYLPAMTMLGKLPQSPAPRHVMNSIYPRSQKIYSSRILHTYLMRGQWKWDPSEKHQKDEQNLLSSAIVAREVLIRACSDAAAQQEWKQEWWHAMLITVAKIIPYLSEEQNTELFSRLESRSCSQHYTPAQRNFVSLLRAVGSNDALHLARSSENLLNDTENTSFSPDLLEYVLSAGLLGNLATGQRQVAQNLLNKYAAFLPSQNTQSATMQLLLSHLKRGRD